VATNPAPPLSGHRTFHRELIETLAESGCVICRLATRSVSRYLDILSYENVNDVALRSTIREGIGLCNRHAWQFIDGTRTPLGTAIIYRDLIRTLQQGTVEPIREADGVAARQRGLLPSQPCVACGALAAMVKDCAHQFQQSWADPAFRDALTASDGLCWPHLLATLQADRFGRRWPGLLAAQWAGWAGRAKRARGGSRPDLLVEALVSAPRMNGAQIDPADAGPAADDSKTVPVEPVEEGHCPACAGISSWLGSEAAALSKNDPGIPCAVHGWHPRRATPGVDAMERQLTQLEERLERIVGADQARSLPARVAARVGRGWTLPPEVSAGLACPICPAQLRQESAVVARLGPATLCVPHLRIAAHHGARFPEIRAETRKTWHVVELQLAEFIRKHDYRFTSEARGVEQGSFRWAVALVAGEEGVR
jgi:hypothetical protein